MVTPANEQNRAQVGELAGHLQEATGCTVEVAFVDQGHTREQHAADAEAQATVWKSGNCLWPTVVLSCCLAAGQSSEPLAG